MAAYVIVDIEIDDPKEYEEYKRLAGPTVGAHGGTYVARVDVDGDPRHLYNRVELISEPGWFGLRQTARAGLELRRESNTGPGYQFDIEFPPQVTFNGVNGFDRPRAWDSIPPLVTSAFYLDDKWSTSIGRDGMLSAIRSNWLG